MGVCIKNRSDDVPRLDQPLFRRLFVSLAAMIQSLLGRRLHAFAVSEPPGTWVDGCSRAHYKRRYNCLLHVSVQCSSG